MISYYFTLAYPLTPEQQIALLALMDYDGTITMGLNGEFFDYELTYMDETFPENCGPHPIAQWIDDNNIERMD